jgi:hypothetical protein
MLNNLQVKHFLSRLMSGEYVFETSTVPAYPTVDARTATIVTKTADYTVTVADLSTPTIFNNAADDGTQTLSLPAVALAKGKVIRAHCLAAQIIRLDASGTESINLHGSAVAGKYVQLAGVIGNYIELFCDGTQWIVTGYSGVVTKEA